MVSCALRGDLIEMLGPDPTEVMIGTLHEKPFVLAAEDDEALAVVRLIDALGRGIRLGVQIREPAVHERMRRPHHRDR